MSHPTPSEKPTNPENPRVFLDVDIGGERGQLVLKDVELVRTVRAALAYWVQTRESCEISVVRDAAFEWKQALVPHLCLVLVRKLLIWVDCFVL